MFAFWCATTARDFYRVLRIAEMTRAVVPDAMIATSIFVIPQNMRTVVISLRINEKLHYTKNYSEMAQISECCIAISFGVILRSISVSSQILRQFAIAVRLECIFFVLTLPKFERPPIWGTWPGSSAVLQSALTNQQVSNSVATVVSVIAIESSLITDFHAPVNGNDNDNSIIQPVLWPAQ